MVISKTSADLQMLRNAMKKDPKAYGDELALQLRHFHATVDIFKSKPAKPSQELVDSATLLAHVTPCYPRELASFPMELVQLLEANHLVMHGSLRKELVHCLIMLRNRDLLASVAVNRLFFQMFRCKDKKLRAQMASHIVSDVKKLNTGKIDNKTNKDLQNFLYKMLEDRNGTAAKCSLDVLVKLYRKKVWEDSKTVNVMASACFSQEAKVRATALNFFLGVDDEQMAKADADSDDDLLDDLTIKQVAGTKDSKGKDIGSVHSKRSKKRVKTAMRRLERIKKGDPAKGQKEVNAFAALQMLNDPLGFAEKLLAHLRKSTDKFEVKLLMMNLVARVIATHELVLLSFYPFVQKYMQPHQLKVTNILAYAAMATHALVPPDAVEPLIRTLALHFISDGRQEEVIAIGLNTVRELCMRQPHAMDAQLLQDLVQYKKHKDKGVVMAARSLLALFRDMDSEMLVKKDRGKNTLRDQHKKSAFGAVDVAAGVLGLELLNEASDTDSDSEGEGEEEEEEEEVRGTRGVVGRKPLREEEMEEDEDDGEEEEDEEDEEEEDEVEQEGGAEGEDMEEDEDEDDGEEEEEDEEEEEEEEEEEVPHPNGEEEEFGEETRVAARFKRSKQLFSGRVTKRNKDGTYRVTFDDGDVDRRVNPRDLGLYNPDDFEASEEETLANPLDALERLDATRALTAEEFDKIRKLKAKHELEATLGRKRGPDAESLKIQSRLTDTDMLGQHKKRRLDKAGRLESVLKGREGREDGWKDRWEKKKLAGGLRNDQAKKNKPYLMVRNSFKVRSKLKEGVGEKSAQTWLKNKQQRGSGGGKGKNKPHAKGKK